MIAGYLHWAYRLAPLMLVTGFCVAVLTRSAW